MSQKSLRNSPVFFVALAGAAMLGAVQFASGHDLAASFQAVSEPAAAAAVNRTGKADRETIARAVGESRTVLVRVDSLADTSVLVRIPVQKDARTLSPGKPALKPAGDKAKRMVACEPVVSVLTEVAKLLQPGRCVT
jgi:hypothetical protein